MENNIQQIVVQLTSAPYQRALSQYGNTLLPSSQQEIIYDSLTDEEKAIWDSFVTMIGAKYAPNNEVLLQLADAQQKYEQLLAQIGNNNTPTI